MQDLTTLLAPDIVLVSDSGGIKQAALRPIVGAERVIRMFCHGLPEIKGTLTGEHIVVNGNPVLALRLTGMIDGVLAIRIENARITGLYYIRNPEKLTRIKSQTALTLG